MTDNHHNSRSYTPGGHSSEHSRGHADEGSHALPGGVTVAANELRVVATETRLEPGESEWSFRIVDKDGNTVTEFEETHEQLAHLILVRRDLTCFQHLHPKMGADGTWSVTASIPEPGAYRAFVDVLTEGQPTTLGVDLLLSGSVDYEDPPGSSRVATVGDYDISMAPKRVVAGDPVDLEFVVRRDGEAVTLEPYLGAQGHLVAVRDGDLAYLHVHPEETEPTEGIVRFTGRFPTAGRYRLFLQAKPDGELVTATFDVTISEP